MSYINKSKLFSPKEFFIGKKIFAFLLIILVLHILIFIISDSFYDTTDGKEISIFQRCIDGIYFTTTTVSTIGYGDITPKHWTAKLLMSLEQIMLIYLSIDEISSN